MCGIASEVIEKDLCRLSAVAICSALYATGESARECVGMLPGANIRRRLRTLLSASSSV